MTKNNFVILMAGPSAAGKTYIASHLKELFPNDILTMGFDNYCRDFFSSTGDFSAVNYDEPASYDGELLAKHINLLKHNKIAEIPLYDFKKHKRLLDTTRVAPKKIIIVEGILSFCYPSLLKEADFRVYVDAKRDIRFERRFIRDQKERGRSPESITNQWNKFVVPMEEKHIFPTKQLADIVIDNSVNNNSYEMATPLVDLIKKQLD